jgi:hypothetical protein
MISVGDAWYLDPTLADESEPVSWGIVVAVAAVLNTAYGPLSVVAMALTFC